MAHTVSTSALALGFSLLGTTVPASAVTAPTPHLDSVEQTLRQVSPGLEGSVWERTSGNRLGSLVPGGADWLLQTPGCWGDAECADRPGSRRLLEKLRRDIAAAQQTVDISTLAPFPDGGYQEAIAAGLRQSGQKGNRLRVRIMVGAAPIYHSAVSPSSYRDKLLAKLGPAAAANITLNVASMTTSKTAFSWNHSKLVVVDGSSVITGGINSWKDDYLETSHPVSDVNLALSGPAAGSAGRYLDTLWDWTCRNMSNWNSVWFAASPGANCMSSLPRPDSPEGEGNVPALAVGGLGVGILQNDPISTFRPVLPTAGDTKCRIGVHDNTNTDRDYDTVNPEESALRALVSSATSHIEISQQDMHATCPPLPRYDVRLYDALAAKLASGVKVRIVVSDPANRGTIGSGGYSQIKSLSEVSDALRGRVTALIGDGARAREALCENLQLATFRASNQPTWADGKPYAQHHKVLSVDGSAFYIGSKNLYPSWLQDFGYIIENPAAARQLKNHLLDPQWRYSQATATYDYTRGLCQI
ncbi:phospholipase D-like domain-containing protein [Streptomyces sp. NPDC093982]|uniref:phospholipase D-like domain-containing protein n=1 Tax=Streptomyces sp. NPDC093982 TaxID=3155077 RepID=UPI00343C413F